MFRAVPVLVAVTLTAPSLWASDWPTYQHDVRRSGVTAESLDWPLQPCWVFQPRHAPQPAWGRPKPVPVEGILELPRVRFDDAYHAVVADGRVFFGTSSDNTVYCLDAQTGRVVWKRLLGGPVRLAPTVWNGRVYVGSDDGHVYCFDAQTGATVWDFRAAPNDRKVLGHGRMISLWPVRTGVLVDDGVAYFAAGIFPGEGVFLYAVHADTGQVIWQQGVTTDSPTQRFSPQGYLLASKTRLFVPLGRTSPAAVDRRTGRLLYSAYFGKTIGGAYALLEGDSVFTGTEQIIAYRQESAGTRFAWFNGRRLIVTADRCFMVNEREMSSLDRQAYGSAGLKRQSLLSQRQSVERDLRAPRGQLAQAKRRLVELKKQLAACEKQLSEARRSEQSTGGRARSARSKGATATASPRVAELEKKCRTLRSNVAATEKNVRSLQKQVERLESTVRQLDDQIRQLEAAMATAFRWRRSCRNSDSLILAGNALVAGGEGSVEAVDAEGGRLLWSARVEGRAKGLAVADGRLFVSTDTGAVYCFGPASASQHGTVTDPTVDQPYPKDELAEPYRRAAEEIVRRTGVTRGFCLVYGFERGRLAVELAKRTELQIYGVEPDAAKVAAARKALDAAGLWGARVTVVQADLNAVPFSDYFANLVVSDTALVTGRVPGSSSELVRLLKPLGGKVCLGQPAVARTALPKTNRLSPQALRQWARDAGLADDVSADETGGVWLTFERGPLPGAGRWTHLYAEPGGTACSDDQLVRAPLTVLWFGDPGPGQMVNRHSRAGGPVSVNGRLFVQGEGVVLAYDAYNGVKLWERKVPGAGRTNASYAGCNLAADEVSVFVVSGAECWRLDAATGRERAPGRYRLPPEVAAGHHWGVVAVVDGVLYGSAASSSTSSDAVFALDVQSGRVLWVVKGKGIPHNTIVIGDGRVFFADLAVDAVGQSESALSPEELERRRRRGQSTGRSAESRRVAAVDARSGRILWQKVYDLTDCGGSKLSAIYHNGVLVLFGVYLDGHYWREFYAGQFNSRRLVALSAEDGYRLWDKRIGYRVRPLVIGDTLHVEPWAVDLHSGEFLTRTNPLTGHEERWQWARPGHHCGTPVAAPNLMLFRSYCIGYYDLLRDGGTFHFSAQRPGCWINFIAANGLVLVPEGSTGCMCPFPNACTVVFKPAERNRAWAVYSLSGPTKPVRHLALNLGAPGDRKDDAGTLWLAFPRPGGHLVLKLPASVGLLPGGQAYRVHEDWAGVEGAARPWLFASGYRGLGRLQIPLADPEDGRSLYTVRLGFADPDNDQPGQRVFDVLVQGRTVLKALDLAAEAGGRNRALWKEVRGVEAGTELVIELRSKTPRPEPNQAPVLQAVEVVRERVLSLGLALPRLELNAVRRSARSVIRVANNRDQPFVGRLTVEVPEGFTAEVVDQVRLEPGERAELPVAVTVVGSPAPRAYKWRARLVRADGSVETDGEATLEYLGNRDRAVFRVVEDAYVSHRYPATNRGTGSALLVDGGASRMKDESHSVALLKFRVDVPGRPVAVRLRLYNAGNPTGNSGQVRLVRGRWSERTVTYTNQPELGEVVAKLGRVSERQVVEVPLDVELQSKQELSLAIDPTSLDGVDYVSREGGKPAELVVEYELPSKR